MIEFRAGDRTSEIQGALDRLRKTGGMVELGPGEFLVSQPLTIGSNTALRGRGKATILTSTAPDAIIRGDTTEGVQVTDMYVQGRADVGIRLDRGSADCVPHTSIRRVWVDGCGIGVRMENPILGVLEQVRVMHCQTGFQASGIVGGAAGTSTVFTGCFVVEAADAGFILENMTYCTLICCAVDKSELGYRLADCRAVTLSACGCEECAVGADVVGGGGNLVLGFYGWTVKQLLQAPQGTLTFLGAEFGG